MIQQFSLLVNHAVLNVFIPFSEHAKKPNIKKIS